MGSAFFDTGYRRGSAVFFPLVSLWCNLALFGLVLVVLRLAKKAGLDIMPCG